MRRIIANVSHVTGAVFKMLCLTSLGLYLLAGCQYWPNKNVEEQPATTPKPPLPAAIKIIEYDELATLLLTRQTLCALPAQERAARIAEYQGSTDKKKQLELLLLATCKPAKTPGLLSNCLRALAHSDHNWSTGEQALLELIAAQSKAYNRLEVRYQKLQEELDNTIKGIKQIETDIGDLNSPVTDKHNGERNDR